MLMRLLSQGTCQKIVFDEGTEFNNSFFRRVLTSLNIQPVSVGYKAAHRVSKLERMNQLHRNNVRKLTVEPYDDHVAVLIWSRAHSEVIGQSLNDALEEFLAAEPNSDISEVEMLTRRELVSEHCFQMNSTPILGTSLTPYNLSSGGFYAGSRDWEQLREDLADSPEFEQLDNWFLTKAKIQAAVRKSVREKDLEQLLRPNAINLGPEELLIKDGKVHQVLREKLRHCVSTMELKAEGGHLFLNPTSSEALATVRRAYDFSCMPQVTEKLGTKTRHHGRIINSDGLCPLFSQVLNGRPVEHLLNAKDNRDVDYVVTAVEIQKNKLYSPSQYTGNSTILRWGTNLAPEFVEEDSSTWSTCDDCWVARIFFEVTSDAQEKLQLYTEGVKSSSIEVDEATAERLGFQSYYVPSVRAEVKAVVGHGIFGRTAKRKDISAKNVMTSRLVVVVKVDLGTGLVSRIKSRWVSRGFEDKRFSKKGPGLNCRSYTMSDTSYLFLMQYCQAMRSNVWRGDVKEALLKGMKFVESYGEEYHADPFSELWMTVPKVIQQMKEEFGLDEVVELLASIYGCKDAPLNWQRTFHRALKVLQFRQSLIDPCLWVVYATPREKKVIQEGKVDEYFWEQIKLIDAQKAGELEACAEIICGGEQEVKNDFPYNHNDDGLLNPQSSKLTEALTMHFQDGGSILGAMGSHVDDTVSGGHKLFMLRLYALFKKFPLGSWTKLSPGTRDNFIGRENHCMPAVIEQHQLNTTIKQHAEELERLDIQVDDFVEKVDEEELVRVEKKFGITRDQASTSYPQAPTVPFTAQQLFDGCDMEEEMVFVVSQQSYANKLKPVDRNEVEKFIVERNRAKSKWQRKNVSNPFRGRIGELIWLTKTNAVIAESVSEMAGQLIAAEQTADWDSVQFFVNDLNGLIYLAQASEASCRRIRRLGGLREHKMFGCGDASKDRVGGTTNLAGPATLRLSTMGQFSKLPKRVFNSSTGIETLAARMVNAELLYAMQVALDLQLVELGTGLLQLVDNKNICAEPREKNLRLDFFALQQLREEGILQISHIPGALNWTDPLTKQVKDVLPVLIYFATVWGVCDMRVANVIQKFVNKKKESETKAEEEEVELVDFGVVKEEKKHEVGDGFAFFPDLRLLYYLKQQHAQKQKRMIIFRRPSVLSGPVNSKNDLRKNVGKKMN
eukprot:g4500.t1